MDMESADRGKNEKCSKLSRKLIIVGLDLEQAIEGFAGKAADAPSKGGSQFNDPLFRFGHNRSEPSQVRDHL